MTPTSISLARGTYGRSSSRYTRENERSKRQERVGHLVRTEIATILQLGYPIKNMDGRPLEEELRRRINVVNADVSPDLRQARITVSIIKPPASSASVVTEKMEDEGEDEEDDIYDDEDDDFYSSSYSGDSIVDKRRAYAWLVKNTKQIRHALSQRLKHMKTVPDLTFVQADVGAAVDVMLLIEKVSKGYKRDAVGTFGGDDHMLPEGMYLESQMSDDDGWIDEDDDEDDFDWEEEYGDEDIEDDVEDFVDGEKNK